MNISDAHCPKAPSQWPRAWRLPRGESRVLDAIYAHRDGCPHAAVLDSLYGDRVDGGPLNALENKNQLVFRLRKRFPELRAGLFTIPWVGCALTPAARRFLDNHAGRIT